MLIRILFFVFLFALSQPVLPSPALAQLKFCNETSYVIDAAFAKKAKNIWQTQGWFRLYPGFCEIVIKKSLRQKIYYVHARSVFEHRGAVKLFGGTKIFCVDSPKRNFTIKSRVLCREKGGEKTGFARIKIGASNFKQRFQEAKPFHSSNHAMVAGVQRLLRENGFEIGDIDGYWGKLTQRTIQEFQRSIKLRPTGVINQKLFDQLLVGAENMLGVRSGFKLCNQTRYLVWASVGYRAINKSNDFQTQRFESKGWVKVLPEDCAMLLRENLGQPRYYIYAEAVDKDGSIIYKSNGEPLVWLGDFPMCLKRLKFKIENRKQCAKRGFQQAPFRRIETRGRAGWTEYLYEEEKAL